MKQNAARLLPAICMALLVAGCAESTSPDNGGSSNAHRKPVLMGNFHINSGPVTTNQDGASTNIVEDYVLPSQIPNVNLEMFTIYLYAPVATGVSTKVSNARATVTRLNGSKTGNIFLSGQFLKLASVAGQEYAVYELHAFYAGAPVLTKANFANVAYELDLEYRNEAGSTLATRGVTLSVYQRN